MNEVIAGTKVRLNFALSTFKFLARCARKLRIKDSDIDILAIIQAISKALSGEEFPSIHISLIVINYLQTVKKIIDEYKWQGYRYKYMGEAMGYLIRIGLETVSPDSLESVFQLN